MPPAPTSAPTLRSRRSAPCPPTNRSTASCRRHHQPRRRSSVRARPGRVRQPLRRQHRFHRWPRPDPRLHRRADGRHPQAHYRARHRLRLDLSRRGQPAGAHRARALIGAGDEDAASVCQVIDLAPQGTAASSTSDYCPAWSRTTSRSRSGSPDSHPERGIVQRVGEIRTHCLWCSLRGIGHATRTPRRGGGSRTTKINNLAVRNLASPKIRDLQRGAGDGNRTRTVSLGS
jgi:hypothetical protein